MVHRDGSEGKFDVPVCPRRPRTAKCHIPFRGPIFFFVCMLAAAPASSKAVSYRFNQSDGLSGWGTAGADRALVRGGVLRVSGGNECRLALPPSQAIVPETDRYLVITLRTGSPRYLSVVWRAGNAPDKSGDITMQLPFDRNFHTHWIELAHSPLWRGRIEQVELIFKGYPGLIEIGSVEIAPFSLEEYLISQWKEFWMPRRLTLASINSLSGPQFLGIPFVRGLGIAALIVLVYGAVAYMRTGQTRRLRVISGIGAAMLFLWCVYDMRETYSQFACFADIYTAYLKPAEADKIFPDLGDFYRFVDLCRKHIPQQDQFHFYSAPDWPFDCRMRYFLYPRRMKSREISNVYDAKAIPWHVVYHDVNIRVDAAGRCLWYRSVEGEHVISKPGRVVATSGPDEFIFREDR
ncbi:MAG: hypothetical protein NTZ78_10885 [Candidatus Aureabacteria bacterium]|nr:hypothetical protein [Candidatus Auribacterota bacterium]